MKFFLNMIFQPFWCFKKTILLCCFLKNQSPWSPESIACRSGESLGGRYVTGKLEHGRHVVMKVPSGRTLLLWVKMAMCLGERFA